MAVISCISLFFLQRRETRRVRPHARSRNKKPGAACRPGSWRSFGEYLFLEDSRYTSQAENRDALQPRQQAIDWPRLPRLAHSLSEPDFALSRVLRRLIS